MEMVNPSFKTFIVESDPSLRVSLQPRIDVKENAEAQLRPDARRDNLSTAGEYYLCHSNRNCWTRGRYFGVQDNMQLELIPQEPETRKDDDELWVSYVTLLFIYQN